MKSVSGPLVKVATLPDGRILRDKDGNPVRENKELKRARLKLEKKIRAGKATLLAMPTPAAVETSTTSPVPQERDEEAQYGGYDDAPKTEEAA